MDVPHEVEGITEDWTYKHFSFSHPQFLPTALLNNLERILATLKPAESAQKSLKSHRQS